jgi:hypothetical protein
LRPCQLLLVLLLLLLLLARAVLVAQQEVLLLQALGHPAGRKSREHASAKCTCCLRGAGAEP